MKRIILEDLVGYNTFICEQENKRSLIINESNLLSALSVQDSYFEADEEIASALFRSLIISHGFQDGNKRTATICLFDTLPPIISDIELEQLTIDIATGKISDVYEIAEILYGVDI